MWERRMSEDGAWLKQAFEELYGSSTELVT